MSIQGISRISAGVPNGGQFAPSSAAESGVVLDGGAATGAPSWHELQEKLDDAVTEWTTQLDEGGATADVADLLGLEDEDEMIEAYGEEGSDFLCSLTFRAEARERTRSASRYKPSESSADGRLEVFGNGRLLARASFTHEDGPDISRLLENAPVGPRWKSC